ncbi:ABC1 kinase family protein [Bacillus tuaregi]|uniref:ABC1 kinase family protein n=1 Tax=Bacillus tuaregi TaxID=1816695 RepID=UPI0008F81CD6|nr:AarF/ABC1/UbiB kinase family protein [Bacillus tuaregi]
MLGKRLKHAQRYQEISNAFLRNGFSHLVYRLGLTKHHLPKNQESSQLSKKYAGIKLREVLQGLGPTFIKLGQIASTRRDLVPIEIAEELEKLQDQVSSFSYQQARSMIELELGESIHTLFHSFSETPLASASIGQVHEAILHTGERVAVKIQRPDIKPIVETDLEILDDLARIMEDKISWAKHYQIRRIIEEFSNCLRAELDYQIEGRNSERIAHQFTQKAEIVIPKVHWSLSTKKILTMDYVDGIKVNNIKKLDEEGYNRKLIAKRITESMLHQILIEGFFHGDPHPGNIYIMPGNHIAYLDFGMVGRLSEDTKYHFASLVINLQRRNTKGLLKAISSMGIQSDQTDLGSLYIEIDEFVMKYSDIPLSKLSIGAALNDLLTIIHHHEIQIPSDLTILGKTLLIIEGVVKDLDPDLSIMDTVKPFGEKLLKHRFEPKKVIKGSWDELVENMQLLSKVPKNLKDLTATIQKGKLHFEISVPEFKQFLLRLDKISNRLAFSIILLSFSILMVGLIIGGAIAGQRNLLWEFPAIEVGSIVATLMFLFILYAIFKSGRM